MVAGGVILLNPICTILASMKTRSVIMYALGKPHRQLTGVLPCENTHITNIISILP